MNKNKIQCPWCYGEDVLDSGTRAYENDARMFRCLNPECNNPDIQKLFAINPDAKC